jgi:protein-tyrosine phosphatase
LTTADGRTGRQGTRARDVERVLFVCTGNICRSPYMELTLRRALDGLDTPVAVGSAGTHALVGEPVAERMRRRMGEDAPAGADFRARQVTSAMLAQASIVVTAEREHRWWVTHLEPSCAPRTFTLKQTARLLRSYLEVPEPRDVGRVADLVARLHDARGHGGAGSDDDDIADPWKRSTWAYRRAAKQIDAALQPMRTFLTR